MPKTSDLQIRIKRVYDAAREEDGLRILVDRLWPRGLSKANARVDRWLRDVAPSTELRRWFKHDATKWREFQRRYLLELTANEQITRELRDEASTMPITLLYAANDTEHNNAVVLKDYLLSQGWDEAQPH